MKDGTVRVLHKITLQAFTNLLMERMDSSEHNKIWKCLEEGENIGVEEGDELKIGSMQLRLKQLINNIAPKCTMPSQNDNE